MPSIICNDVNVQLNHLADIPLWKKEKPFELNLTGLNSQEPRTNCEYTQQNVGIRDLRTLSLEPSIDTTGFKFIKHVSTCLPSFETLSNEGDSSAIVPYLEETVDLVKNELHAEKAFAIDWRVCIFRFP